MPGQDVLLWSQKAGGHELPGGHIETQHSTGSYYGTYRYNEKILCARLWVS